MNPALGQLHHDLHMFLSRALTDLAESVRRMEKARTEYRAALLWMKKESGKLSDPDNSGQLTKFRHVRGTRHALYVRHLCAELTFCAVYCCYLGHEPCPFPPFYSHVGSGASEGGT